MATLLSHKRIGESFIITFVNPHACFLDSQHHDFVNFLDAFNIVACDGIGMVVAARSFECPAIKRESFDFTSLANDVFQEALKQGWTIGLVGGKPTVAVRAAKFLKDRYPGLDIVACFSGYGPEPEKARQYFTENQTELVICGMGAPKQEEFLIQLVSGGWHGLGFTCGGFLDQVINWKGSYPEWIDRYELRFLYRLIKEPRRLWRRYLVEYQVFLKRYFGMKWGKIKSTVKNSSLLQKLK